MDIVYQNIIDSFDPTATVETLDSELLRVQDLRDPEEAKDFPVQSGFAYLCAVAKDNKAFLELHERIYDLPFVCARIYGRTRGHIAAGRPLGFLENWLTDFLSSQLALGMHEEDIVARELLRALLVIPYESHNLDFSSPDQQWVAAERRLFNIRFPDASEHYRGRYWCLFCRLLNSYLDAKNKDTILMPVEDWVFDRYDKIIASVRRDTDFPPVFMCGYGCDTPFEQTSWPWIYEECRGDRLCHPSLAHRRPSSKDAERIVRSTLSYIAKRCNT